MWILHTRYNLYKNPPSSGRQCHKYKGSVSKHVQTPKEGLSCNCLSFCTQNLLRRTATRVYIIQEVNTYVHSLSTEYNVCLSTQYCVRVPARVSDATMRVRINEPTAVNRQCPGRLQVLDHTVYRAHEICQNPTRRPNAITKVPRGVLTSLRNARCVRACLRKNIYRPQRVNELHRLLLTCSVLSNH